MSIHGTRYAVSRSQVPPLHGCSRCAGTRNGAGPRLAIRVDKELVGDARTHQELPRLQFPVNSIDKGQVLIFLSNLRTVPRAWLSC